MNGSNGERVLRQHLAHVLEWKEAHAGLDAAFEAFPHELRGVRPSGFRHSAWELLEHTRLAQRDILDFVRDPEYPEKRWPDDYWPTAPAPTSEDAWEHSLRGYREDRAALRSLVLDPDADLLSPIPHGDGQTLLREVLLAADHAAYHTGQVVLLRRALGIWNAR